MAAHLKTVATRKGDQTIRRTRAPVARPRLQGVPLHVDFGRQRGAVAQHRLRQSVIRLDLIDPNRSPQIGSRASAFRRIHPAACVAQTRGAHKKGRDEYAAQKASTCRKETHRPDPSLILKPNCRTKLNEWCTGFSIHYTNQVTLFI
ncbi:hypothetical protein D3C80_1623350 [compost metagenome]